MAVSTCHPAFQINFQLHLVLWEKAPIDIHEYYDVQKSSIHEKFAVAKKKRMNKELHERGNGAVSEDVSTDSNSSDKGGSNQVPVHPNTLAGTSLLRSTFGSSFLTPIVCSSSLPLASVTEVVQQPKLTCIQKVATAQQDLCIEPIVNFALVTDKALFLESVESNNKQQTAQFVADELEQVAKETVPLLPVSKAKERKIHMYLKNKRIFAYDPVLAETTLLDLPFGVNSLTQDEFTDAHHCAASKITGNQHERLEGMFMPPSCLSINSSLLHDSGDGLVEDDLPDIAFEDALDEKEEQLLQQL
ncbi:hypothetical protein QYM36_007777 [Artemia franciscana]|uniref:Uncharacterized protein n=1 Tax=Artemia franciscana TaxID=6661 RepID=A0AA88ING7_ARTSF|nr:hypothetical protein QYM36_007777 [Artemia franciscana]